MNMPNNTLFRKTLTVILAGTILVAGFTLDAQSSKKKKKEKEEIPEIVLQPGLSKLYIDKTISDFTEWATAPYKPDFKKREVRIKDPNAKAPELSAKEIKRLKAEAKKAGRKYEPPQAPEIVYSLTIDDYRRQILALKSLVMLPESLDDLEEVTGERKEWYVALAAAAGGIGKPVADLERAFNASDEVRYKEVFKSFKDAVDAFEKQAKSKPPKLSSSYLTALKEKNIKRRTAAYLKRQAEQESEKPAKTENGGKKK